MRFYCELLLWSVSKPNSPYGTVKFELHLELQYFIHRTFFWESLMGNRTQENAVSIVATTQQQLLQVWISFNKIWLLPIWLLNLNKLEPCNYPFIKRLHVSVSFRDKLTWQANETLSPWFHWAQICSSFDAVLFGPPLDFMTRWERVFYFENCLDSLWCACV